MSSASGTRQSAEAFTIGTNAGEPDAGLYFNGQFPGICARRGTLGDIAELIAQTARENPGLPALTGNLARAHVQGGNMEDARRLLDDFARSGFDPPLDFLWLIGMAGWAEVAIACRDPQYAGPIFDRLAPWADQLTYIDLVTEGPVSLYLGGLAAVLGRYDEAEAYFTKSADFCGRTAAKCFAAQTDLWWGSMLAERGAPGIAGSPPGTGPPVPRLAQFTHAANRRDHRSKQRDRSGYRGQAGRGRVPRGARRPPDRPR